MKRILAVAGADPTSGAGLQADLLTMAALGAWPMSAVTAITVQDTRAVSRVEPVEPGLVALQMRACLADVGADAIKLGMLANQSIIEAVAAVLEDYPGIPVVADPLLAGTAGGVLLADEAMAAYRRLLFPRIAILTPNVPEASRWSGCPIHTHDDMLQAAAMLVEEGPAVLITGGHLAGLEVRDLWCDRHVVHWFCNPRLMVGEVHGTGCTLASALAVSLAQQGDGREAAASAIAFTRHAIQHSLSLGQGQRLPWRGPPKMGEGGSK